MPFVPSAAAQALAQQAASQLQQRRAVAEANRRRLMAVTNALRCATAPVYGQDLLAAMRMESPVHHVNLIKHKVLASHFVLSVLLDDPNMIKMLRASIAAGDNCHRAGDL